MADRKDWLTPEQLAESRRIAHEADTFRLELLGQWPTSKLQCGHQGAFDRCPEVARFTIRKDGEGEAKPVCDRCLVPVLIANRAGTIFVIEVLGQ